jgi:ssDNA-binding Zn-finger/Zn-ribbon topoisomerase 1
MGMETSTLIINQIEWQYQKSNELTPDRQPSLKKVGIKSMEVKCKKCGHEWNTRKGYNSGDFNLEIGHAVLDCPICSTTHTVTSKELN